MIQVETASQRQRNMKKFTLLFVFLCFAATPGIASAAEEPGVAHVVLVWLKEPGNVAHRQQIIEGTHRLREIPGVLDLQVGEVIQSERDVVDDSYDVALYFRFASRQALQEYLVHPRHKTTVKEQFVSIMARFRVFDFALSPPPDE